MYVQPEQVHSGRLSQARGMEVVYFQGGDSLFVVGLRYVYDDVNFVRFEVNGGHIECKW